MGMLDRKSETKNLICFNDSTESLMLLNLDNPTEKVPEDRDLSNYSDFVEVLKSKKYESQDWDVYDLIYYRHYSNLFNIGEEYSMNVLINMDLSSNFYEIETQRLRYVLCRYGLINEYDRLFLNNLGFKEEHMNVEIDDLSLSKGTKRFLSQIGCEYLWQILFYNNKSIQICTNQCANYNARINELLEEYGYSLSGFIKKPIEDIEKEISKLESRQLKVIEFKRRSYNMIEKHQYIIKDLEAEYNRNQEKINVLRKQLKKDNN